MPCLTISRLGVWIWMKTICFDVLHDTRYGNKCNYYTTLLKSVQITRKTSTNTQRYSDSWLFVYFWFDEFVFSQSNFASAAVLHVC